MSTVALPHVPSARAPSSAASSTRRSVHSAGSTASQVSAKSLRQRCDEDEGEDEEEEDDEEHGEEEEDPHESSHGSGGLWDEVETFLNKPSPSFAAITNDRVNVRSGGGSVLPTLRNGDRKQPVAPSGGNQSGSRASRPTVRLYAKQSSASSSSKPIDPKLLQEAFAYAEKIQRVSFEDDDEEPIGEQDQQREAERRGVGMLRRDASFGSNFGGTHGPRMPPDGILQKQGNVRGKTEEASKKKKSTKTSAYGASVKPQVSKKMPIERRGSKDISGWDTSPSSAEPNGDGVAHGRKASASMDQQTIQSLVSSLHNGTALEELRRELVASQQSMAASRQVIQDAAKSFFHK